MTRLQSNCREPRWRGASGCCCYVLFVLHNLFSIRPHESFRNPEGSTPMRRATPCQCCSLFRDARRAAGHPAPAPVRGLLQHQFYDRGLTSPAACRSWRNRDRVPSTKEVSSALGTILQSKVECGSHILTAIFPGVFLWAKSCLNCFV